MKYLFIVLLMSVALSGCTESNHSHGIAATSSDQRKAQIIELFNLKDEEAFWEVYADYEKEISDIRQEHAELASKFNTQYDEDSMDEQQAINILAQYFRIEAKSHQTKQNYMSIFQKVLPLEDVFRLYQLDHQ